MFILTTDFRDLTDVYHERKRAYPVKSVQSVFEKKTTDIRNLTDKSPPMQGDLEGLPIPLICAICVREKTLRLCVFAFEKIEC